MNTIKIKPHILLGPGPSCVPPRVLDAMSTPLVGHTDPQFVRLMNGVQELLRDLFQSQNQLTIPVVGTGSGGMETALANFIEPGDPVLMCVIGYFGERMVEIASRYGAQITRLDCPWGEVIDPQQIEAALNKTPARLVTIVHTETSTGVMQPMDGIADIVHAHGALLVMDCVASLGGIPVKVDEWGIDVAFSCSQKCISAPPGLAPLTVGERAEAWLPQRKSKVGSWFFDLNMIRKTWGKERAYHFTAPVNMIYALYESLILIQEEGLERRWERHRENAEYLWRGLAELGINPSVPSEYRPPSITTFKIPVGLDEAAARRTLSEEYDIEIADGIGRNKGQVWRIGLMGYSSQRENVDLVLTALNEVLNRFRSS